MTGSLAWIAKLDSKSVHLFLTLTLFVKVLNLHFICVDCPILQGFAIPKEDQPKVHKFDFHGQPAEIKHGSVVIAAITSCTNTSNPSVMLGAGLVAKKAADLGLYV